MSTTEFEFEQLLAKPLATFMREELAIVRAEIEALKLRVVEAETKAAEFRYRGVWQPGEQYRRNNFITFDGSVWVCLRDTEGRPAQSMDWQLAVRKGKDAKAAA